MTEIPTDTGAGGFGFGDERIQPIELQTLMQQSYIDYAMTVIVGRALPDVRDGLKPVHRRILYAMYDGGYRPDRGFSKCSRVVGDVMGQYHPHGDSAIYDTMVRLAQPWVLRAPLINGQGNFGSPGNDSAAAMRYTECRMAPLAMEMVRDIDEDTVDFRPNYDGRSQEPTILPSRFPNLLVNGSAGIAVGMATNIPPHNLREVAEGATWALEHPDATKQELQDALIERIKGPDFPNGALIVGRQGIEQAYRTGRGSISQRAVGDLAQVVRRNVGGHADRDAGRPVDQQVGVPARQDGRLLGAAVVVGLEVDGLLLDVADHLQRQRRHPALGVPHGRGSVGARRAEVALSLDQRRAHHPRLRETHQGVVDRRVAVRVVLTHHVADDARALGEAAVRPVATVVHRVEDAAVHRLQPVAYVGQRASDDDGHRIVDVGLLHQRLQLDGLDAIVAESEAVGAGAGGDLSHSRALLSCLRLRLDSGIQRHRRFRGSLRSHLNHRVGARCPGTSRPWHFSG